MKDNSCFGYRTVHIRFCEIVLAAFILPYPFKREKGTTGNVTLKRKWDY